MKLLRSITSVVTTVHEDIVFTVVAMKVTVKNNICLSHQPGEEMWHYKPENFVQNRLWKILETKRESLQIQCEPCSESYFESFILRHKSS